MDRETIHVVGHITAAPGKELELGKLLLQLVEPSRRQDGCLRYELLQRLRDPCEFVLVAEWLSTEALDLHLASPHVVEVLGQIGPLSTEPAEVHQYLAID
jgi:quinol monooxygenase YgiN